MESSWWTRRSSLLPRNESSHGSRLPVWRVCGLSTRSRQSFSLLCNIQRLVANTIGETNGGEHISTARSTSTRSLNSPPRTVSLAVQSVVRYSQDTPRGCPSELSTPTACGFELQGNDLGRKGIPILDFLGKTASQPSEGGGGGQCQSPRQPQCEGEQVSMSQRGPAPRPAPRRSSPSPTRDVASSPNPQPGLPRQDDSNILPPSEPGGRPLGGTDSRRQSRTSGVQVHDILNPPEPQRDLSGSSGPRQAIKEESPPLHSMGPGHHGSETSPTHYHTYPPPGTMTTQQQQQHLHQPNPIIPPPGIPPLARGSPLLTTARRILTPRSPRAVSLSRAASRALESHHITSFSPNTPRSAAPPPHDVSPLSGSPATGESYLISGPTRAHGTPPGPPMNRPISGLNRSLSQPMIGHGVPTARQDALQTHGLGRGLGSLPAAYTPAPPFTPPVPSGGAMVGQGLMGEWRWGSGPLAAGQTGGGAGSRGLQITEGHQHLITITPDHGEKILVPVNTHEGSKQMNEKRQRNAGASARFRHRKKIKDQAMMEEMQKLEAQNRELQRRVKELEEERDFYMQGGRPGEFRPRSRPAEERAERGPSSPVSSRSGGSFTNENSPLPTTSAPSAPSAPPAQHSNPYPHPRGHTLNHPHPPPMSYGDPSMLERPARRRRIDSAPELASFSHSSSPPGSLPPLPPSVYGMPPSPHLAEQAGSARLPPLRYDQPAPSTPTPPPVASGAPPPPIPQQHQQQQHRPGASYPPYSTGSYETGWALEYKGQPENRSK